MADAVFGIIILYSFIAGARRGFYKEVVHVLALVVSVYATRSLYGAAGAKIAAGTGGKVPLMLAEVVGACVVWVASFFVAAVVGRLLLKKIRGKGMDDNLGEGAEAVADALGGDTTKGPVTLLTDPIATKTGIFYWSDKILGAGLGVAKGAITAYIVFGLCFYADRARGWDWDFVESIESSWSGELYRSTIDPYLATFPAYKIATSIGHMNAIADAIKEDPWRLAAVADHPELRPVARSKRIQELTQDDEIIAAWRKGDIKGLLLNEKVRALLSDQEFRQTVADVDWEKVREDVEKAERKDAVDKLIPDGRGGTFSIPILGGGGSPEAPPEEGGTSSSGVDPRGGANALLPSEESQSPLDDGSAEDEAVPDVAPLPAGDGGE